MRLTAPITFFALLCSTADARAQLFCPASNTNLRIMNLNVHCMGSPFTEDTEEIYDMTLEARMVRVADMIAKIDPDVVAIEDAFFEECKDELERRLAPTFPHFVRRLDKPARLQDSGMMLFSKHPFEAFPNPFRNSMSVTVSGRAGFFDFTEVTNFVAWYLFDGALDELRTWDQYAAKAAAMVRIVPTGGCPLNVVFTHFQADQADGDVEQASSMRTRFKEREGLKAMVTGTLTPGQLLSEPIFVAGDLNIDGNLSPFNLDVHGFKYKFLLTEDVAKTTEAGEWHEVYDPAHVSDPEDPAESRFFRCGTFGFSSGSCQFNPPTSEALFTDAWGWEFPRSDFGQTSGIRGQKSGVDVAKLTEEGGERLDYILHNQPTIQMTAGTEFICAQRMQRVFFMDPDGPPQFFIPVLYRSVEDDTFKVFADDTVVADHIFLVGDFLFTRTPRCSPVPAGGGGPSFGAQRITWAPSSQDSNHFVSLGSAGTGNRRQFSWFVLDHKGTVSIGTTAPNDVRIEVFHRSDLSTPISAYYGMTNSWELDRFSGPIFSLPDPPYHVRFSIADGTTAALPVAFTASFHKHNCTSPRNDFCTLSANTEFPVLWPGGQHVMPYEWFVFPPYPDSLYFVFGVDQADSGANPGVQFLLELEDESQFQVESLGPEGARIFDKCSFDGDVADCGSGVCNTPAESTHTFTGWTPDSDGDGLTETRIVTDNAATGVLAPVAPGTPKPFFLRVRRLCAEPLCTEQAMSVTYETSLRRLVPLELTCEDEGDPFDDDEIHLRIDADLPGPGADSCEMMFGFTDLGRFDEDGENNKRRAEFPGTWGIGSSTFIESTTPTLCEYDDGSANDFCGDPQYSFSADPIPPGETQIVRTAAFDADEDSLYRYTFSVRSENLALPAQTCP